MRIRKDVAFLVVVAVVALLALGGFMALKKKREDGIFDKIGNFFGNVGKTAVAGAKQIAGATTQAYNAPAAPAYVPTFSGRQWDKYDWSCPWWTVETGNPDNSKACYNQPFTSQTWRWDGKQWGWSCPNGTTPNNDPQWEKKCIVGYMGRVYTDNGWICPGGTTDTGKNWGNSDWYSAQQQCQRGGPYTTRIMVNKKWVCPPGSKDTGLSWDSKDPNDPDRGSKQCKWTA